MFSIMQWISIFLFLIHIYFCSLQHLWKWVPSFNLCRGEKYFLVTGIVLWKIVNNHSLLNFFTPDFIGQTSCPLFFRYCLKKSAKCYNLLYLFWVRMTRTTMNLYMAWGYFLGFHSLLMFLYVIFPFVEHWINALQWVSHNHWELFAMEVSGVLVLLSTQWH